MTMKPVPSAATRPKTSWVAALGIALLMQTTSSCLTRVFPVMGPAITEAAGVPSESIGILASVGSAGTMWWLVSGGRVLSSLGAVRTLQIGALLGVAGLAVAMIGGWWALLAASLLIGLGYGPSPPAGSDILKRYAPARHRSLVFSIKQSGVPLGGAIAGLLVPVVLLAMDWRAACLAVIVLTLASVVAAQPFRRVIDVRQSGEHGPNLRAFVDPRSLLNPFRSIGLNGPLLTATYVSIGFAIVQGSVFAFLVTYLAVDVGLGLAIAGLAFATLQGAGVIGRVVVGWAADRIGSARSTLIILSLASGITTIALAAVGPQWSHLSIVALSALAGIAIASWNGVFLAEVSSLVPDSDVAEATAATTFFTFCGYVVGPSAFGAMIAFGWSYEAAFVLIAAAPLTGAAVLAMTPRSTTSVSA
jgi:MFS family permease